MWQLSEVAVDRHGRLHRLDLLQRHGQGEQPRDPGLVIQGLRQQPDGALDVLLAAQVQGAGCQHLLFIKRAAVDDLLQQRPGLVQVALLERLTELMGQIVVLGGAALLRGFEDRQAEGGVSGAHYRQRDAVQRAHHFGARDLGLDHLQRLFNLPLSTEEGGASQDHGFLLTIASGAGQELFAPCLGVGHASRPRRGDQQLDHSALSGRLQLDAALIGRDGCLRLFEPVSQQVTSLFPGSPALAVLQLTEDLVDLHRRGKAVPSLEAFHHLDQRVDQHVAAQALLQHVHRLGGLATPRQQLGP